MDDLLTLNLTLGEVKAIGLGLNALATGEVDYDFDGVDMEEIVKMTALVLFRVIGDAIREQKL